MRAFPLAAVSVEVPPRNPVLRADNCRVRADERREPRRHGRQAVRFEREQHHIDRANCGGVIGGRDARVKVSQRSAPAATTANFMLILYALPPPLGEDWGGLVRVSPSPLTPLPGRRELPWRQTK